MKKALLTKQDVYDFICEAIQKEPRPLLTIPKLANALKISTFMVHKYIQKGLPVYHSDHRTYLFDYSEVVKWLIDNGYDLSKRRTK